jgi:hypothetical protein
MIQKRILFCVFVLIGACPLAASAADWYSPSGQAVGAPSAHVLSSTQESTVIEFDLPGVWMQEDAAGWRRFDRVWIEGGGVQAEVGKPDLPAYRTLIAIPADKRVSIEIKQADSVLLRGFDVAPWQKPPLRPPFVSGPQNFEIDQAVYNADAFWPSAAAQAGDPALLRDYRVVQLCFSPVCYNPQRRELRVYTHLEVELTYSGVDPTNELTSSSSEQSAAWQKLYRDVIANYGFLEPAGIAETDRMLIIVYDSFYDHILPYAEWKKQKGVDVTVVKKSQAGSTADQIKTYIQGIYNSWDPKPEYVLLVGDVNQIPWFTVGSNKSDMPYAFLAGGDILADVTLARFSVESNAQLDAYVQKSVEFEKSPYTGQMDWFDSATVIASNDCNDFSNGEQAAQTFRDNGFTQVDELQARWGNNTWTNVNNAINAGRSWIWYIGHGWADGWATVNPYYTSDDVRNLSNGKKQPVIVSTACNNCDLDAGECFGEVWMRYSADKGAANFFGYTESCAFYTTDALALGMLDGYFDMGYTSFGSAIDYGRIVMYNQFGSGGCSDTMYQSILIGDPDQFAWSDVPSQMDVAYPDTLPTGPSEFVVMVTHDGSPVQNALVCIWKGDEVWQSGRTGADGRIAFEPEPQTPGTMLVTVSARNYFVHEGSAEVTEGGCKQICAPDPEPYCDGPLFDPGWVWFSIPLDPDDCCGGGDCYDPETVLGFDCHGKLWYWDKYGKNTQVYDPPFVDWDLTVGEGYLMRLDSSVANPCYYGVEPGSGYAVRLGRRGWTWVGKPGSDALGYPDFMTSVRLEYPVGGAVRSAQEDWSNPSPWLSWGWSFWDTNLQAAKTFTPYWSQGINVCHPWIGYRVYVNVGTAQSPSDTDQATIIWP